MLILVKKLFTVDILYYIPRTLILQQFLWQTEDIRPEFPRINKFLKHWYTLDCVTKEINIVDCEADYRVIKELDDKPFHSKYYPN